MHCQTKNKYEMIHKNTNLDVDGNLDIDRIIFQNILIVSMMNFAMHRILFRKRILGTLLFIVPKIVFERLSNLTAPMLGSR